MDSTRHPSSGWDAAADEAVGVRRLVLVAHLNLFFVLNASKTPISTSHIILPRAMQGYNSGKSRLGQTQIQARPR